MLKRLIERIGLLRFLLALGIVGLSAVAPFSGGGVRYAGWAMFPTLIVPAIVPMLFFVLPLDMIMCGVYMSGANDAKRRRYRFIVAMDALLFAVLFLAWLPFFLSLLRG